MQNQDLVPLACVQVDRGVASIEASRSSLVWSIFLDVSSDETIPGSLWERTTQLTQGQAGQRMSVASLSMICW